MSCHCRFVQFSLTVPQSFSSTAQQYTQLRPGLLAENNLGKALPLFPGSSYHQSQRKSFVMSSTNFSHNKFFAYQNPYGLLLQLECCCFLGRQYDRHWQPSALNKAAACAKEALNEGYSNSMSIQALASNQNHLHTFLHHQSEHCRPSAELWGPHVATSPGANDTSSMLEWNNHLDLIYAHSLSAESQQDTFSLKL